MPKPNSDADSSDSLKTDTSVSQEIVDDEEPASQYTPSCESSRKSCESDELLMSE